MQKPKSNAKKADLIAYLEAHQINHDPESSNKDLFALIPADEETPGDKEDAAASLKKLKATEEAARVKAVKANEEFATARRAREEAETVKVETVKKHTKKEMEELVADYFDRFPKVDEFYGSTDGDLFFHLKDLQAAKGATVKVLKFNR